MMCFNMIEISTYKFNIEFDNENYKTGMNLSIINTKYLMKGGD